MYRTAYCGPSGVLIIEVSLYRTAYCGPNGVLTIEVSLYRTAHCGPSGVLIIEVSLYRRAYYGPSGVLIIEVSLYRTAYSMWCPRDVVYRGLNVWDSLLWFQWWLNTYRHLHMHLPTPYSPLVLS